MASEALEALEVLEALDCTADWVEDWVVEILALEGGWVTLEDLDISEDLNMDMDTG